MRDWPFWGLLDLFVLLRGLHLATPKLTGYDVDRVRIHPGGIPDVAFHWLWRAPRPKGGPLFAHVHFKGEGAGFGDDFIIPPPLPGLADGAQHVMERRRVFVPGHLPPGRYRIVLGAWDPASGQRLRRRQAGLLPTLDHTVELGAGEVLPPS